MSQEPVPDRWPRPHTHLAGLDWAIDHHDIVIVDPAGTIVKELRINDDAEGWAELGQQCVQLGAVAFCIETRSGPVVERLLQAGLAVYPVNPLAAKSYRERKAPAGVKDDRLDAWSLADALRTDGHGWKRLKPEDPIVQELRLLCRDEVHLIARRTALVNELRAALREYFPAALEAFEDWTVAYAWAFIERFPTAPALEKAGKRAWEKFLHAHRLGQPAKYQERLEIFRRATTLHGSEAVTRAKSLLAVSLARQLRVLGKQLEEYRQRIEEVFARHPDSGLFDSLPGAGPKLAPRLLAECGDDRDRFDSPQALQCYAGTAPVTQQSGRRKLVRVRFACDKHLRSAVHLWADLSRHQCDWAQTYYQKKRETMSHACALRCLGQRWLKILWKMIQTRTQYNAERHTRDQIAHGSWVVPPAGLPAPAQS
jgi:transposase